MKDRKQCKCGTYYKPPGRPVLHEECRKCKAKRLAARRAINKGLVLIAKASGKRGKR